MRRVLVVTLIVFAVGLALLLSIDRATAPTPVVPEPEAQPTTTQVQGGTGEPVQVPDNKGQATEVSSSGPIRLTEVDAQTLVRRYDVRARDHRTLAVGAIAAEGIELEVFDEQGERAERSVQATRGTIRVRMEAGQPGLDPDQPIDLEEVQARLGGELRFAPIVLTIPRLQAWIGERTLRSEDALEITGTGLEATGQGLFADGTAELLRIERDAHVELELGDGRRASLDAVGPLTLSNRPDLGPDLAAVEARGGARLALVGADSLQVEAPLILLVGRVQRDPDRFVPLWAEAEGGVELRPEEGRFLGERASVRFDEAGHLASGRLSGSPRVELELSGVELPELPGQAPGGPPRVARDRLPIVGEGASELTLEFGETTTFVLDGPARFHQPTLGGTLTSQGPIRGAREELLGYGALQASGGVVVESGELDLEAPEIGLEAFTEEGSEEVYVRLTTQGATRASGPSEDGRRRFVLRAREGLVAVRRGEEVEIPRATDVELDITGEEPLWARAEELRDLVVRTLAFEAEGDVEVVGPRGRGEGERLTSRGREQAELRGGEDAPARATLPQGSLTAARIERDGERLSASGEARALLGLEGYSVDLAARWMELGPGSPRGGLPQAPVADWALDAGGDVHGVVVTPEARHEIRSQLLRLEADEELRDGRRRFSPAGLEAVGTVEASYQAGFSVRGRGERLTYDREGVARLEPLAGERVSIEGELPERGVTFSMQAAALEYGRGELSAVAPAIEIDGLDLPLLGEGVPLEDARLRAVAGHFLVDRRSLLFSERVYIARLAQQDVSWSLDADRVQLVGRDPQRQGAEAARAQAPPSDELPLTGALEELYAWGGFLATSAEGFVLSGERLHVSRLEDRVIAQGEPASVTGRGARWESEWFEIDRRTRSIKAAAGQVSSTVEGASSWSLRYSSLEPIETPEGIVEILREPVVERGEEELRASWALFWIDSARWGAADRGAAGPSETGERPSRPRMRSLFGELEHFEGVDWLREVYLEGNVAYTLEGESKARAEALYVDLVDGHGWVRDINLETRTPLLRRRTPMKLRADWLRHSADGTYSAVGALATTCSHEEPHYKVRIGNLDIIPRTELRQRRNPETGETEEVEVFSGWGIKATGNQLLLWRDVGLPLPKIDVPVDERYRVQAEDVTILGLRPLSFGSDAKFGTFVGTSFSVDLQWLADLLDRLIGIGRDGAARGPGMQAGKADLDARWLGGRGGLLLGLEVPFYSPGNYWIDVAADGIFDDGEDRGLVRVPSDERSLWRGWYRARGRYLVDEREWLDVVGTFQSDPGFQAEYLESDYLRFEERESFLHYRKASADRAFAATVEAHPQSWRTEIVDQPAMTFFDGRSRVGTIGDVALLYGMRTDAGYFSRQEGSGGYEQPFADGLGERDILRFDTDHRLEAPIDLTLAGLRVTPYVEGRFTAWNEGADPDEQPARAGLLAGGELATTLYRAFASGNRHAVTPSIGVRSDLATSEDDVALVPIDRTELPLEGTYVDLDVRSRWTHAERPDTLDIALGITHATDVGGDLEDGWLPLRTRGIWLSTMLGIPYMISHDGRYDLDDDLTEYSRAVLAFEPAPAVNVELGHHFGRDPATDLALYEAVSLGAIWRFSPKWEVEGRQTISSQGDGRLASGFLLRRVGHDFVFEIETRYVAGEGSSFGFRLEPLLLWAPSGFSLLDRARRDSW